MDTAVNVYGIDIVTQGGIVTLSGTVNNLLAKERAAAIARSVRGVKGVVNRLTVVPPRLSSDREIKDAISDALLNDAATDAYEVNVTVVDNIATITGNVDSHQEKQLVEKVVKSVSGVVGVKNQITVDYDTSRRDPEIAAEVRKALRWDVLVDHVLVDVAVSDGTVILSGVVGSAAEKTEAVRDAWVAGVKTVDASGLEVKRWARDADLRESKYVVKSDAELVNAVKDALFYDPRIDSAQVTVSVDDGVATLRGSVESLKAKRNAARDARNIVGVAKVNNRLKVRPDIVVSDQRLENRVKDALVREPYADSYEITVEAANGVVDLYGTVDTYYEKSRAEDAASRVYGVLYVNNHLAVDDAAAPYVYDPYLEDTYVYDNAWYDYQPPTYTLKSDAEIRDDIQDELWWSPFVDANDVNVTVNDGVAVLTGTVDSWSEFDAAAENAWEGGATWVDNNLSVQ
jgi:osmotically-inducible protein OsmY